MDQDNCADCTEQRYDEVGERSDDRDEDVISPVMAKVQWIHRHWLCPRDEDPSCREEREERNDDRADQIDVGNWVECDAAHLFCRRIATPQRHQAVRYFVDDDGKKENR